MSRNNLLVVMAVVSVSVALWSAERQPAFVLAGPGVMLRWTTWTLLATAGVLAALAPDTSRSRGWIAFVACALLLEEGLGPGTAWPLVLTLALAASGGLSAGIAAGAASELSSPRSLRWSGVAATTAIVAAMATVLVTDPRRRGCFDCEPNRLAVVDRPALGGAVAAASTSIAAAVVFMGLVEIVRAARRGRVPNGGIASVASAAVALCVVGRAKLVGGTDAVVTGPGRAVLAVAIAVMAAALWQPVVAGRRERRALLDVVRRAASAPVGSLEQALRAITRDPFLTLCYVMDDGSLVDASGDPAPPPSGEVIRFDRDGREIALLARSPAGETRRRPLDDIAAVTGIALAHERDAAALAAQLGLLANARRAAIERSDLERRALERELHDHAQQRLVSIMIELRRAADGAASPADIEAAIDHVGRALGQVRTISHGIYPTGLAEEGLVAALDELALRSTDHIDVTTRGGRRADPVVEATAYMIVAGCTTAPTARRAGAGVSVVVDSDRIDVRATGHRLDGERLFGLQARTLALGGTWTSDDEILEVSLPCGS